MSVGKRYTIEEVRNIFIDAGCEILSDEYVNANSPLDYRCVCGNVAVTKLRNFLDGSRCKLCGNEKSGNKQRGISKPSLAKHTIGELRDYYHNHGCELLDDKYTSVDAPMSYRCKCGRRVISSFYKFSHGRRQCIVCTRSGNNNYQWRHDREAYRLECKFRMNCRTMLKNVLTKTGRTKTDKTHRLLGYSFRALIERITKHPNWSKVKDYVWHIDHIFPIKAFTDHGIMDVQLINCLDNLQPMLGKDNCSKNAKYNEANFLTWVTNR